jgi:hypothetical protein
MAYIGKQPVVGNFVKLDTITTSATATYNLLNGGVAYFPQTANNCIVSLNGVIQSPTSAYTISGSTIIFSDALTSSDTIDFILVLGDVLSIGTPSDGTITSAKLASGTDGLFAWQSVQTTGFTAVAARAYPCNTTSSAFTVTLPASPTVGDQVLLLDYAGTFDTNTLTVNPNSNKIEGGTANLLLTGDREGVTLTYIDSTQGWLATSGIQEGTDGLEPNAYSIDFLVVAGGGGAGNSRGGGGGGGGYRTSTQSATVGTVITVTVGDGGAAAAATTNARGTNGSDSSISGSGLTTITSAGGGGGGAGNGTTNDSGLNGGSGGGGSGTDTGSTSTGGSGNTPSTSPSQGNNGGIGRSDGVSYIAAGGGGGAGATGSNGNTTGNGANGGAGLASSITGSSVTRAGGGAGGGNASGGSGGSGGGGNTNTSGTANTGGGGGGSSTGGTGAGAGGKGVVILSMLATKYTGTTTGSPTVSDNGSYKVLTFNGSGSYTA